ncbi:hypothetical protein FHT76_007889 [Rhizobium sp. BK176]|nr:hypothetical protein [Rhizobium sp. BK399]MCS4096168.1 hypothetical protein [Rhizobium sp. BK176]
MSTTLVVSPRRSRRSADRPVIPTEYADVPFHQKPLDVASFVDGLLFDTPKRPSLGIEPASLDGNLCSRLSPHPGDQALQFRLFHQDRRLSRVPPRPFPLASFGKPRALASNLEQIDADDWVTLSLPLRNFA